MAGKTLYDKKKKGTAKNEKFVYKSVWNSTLDAGAGNDVIVLGRSSANINIYDGEIMDVTYTSKIYGGAGNDTIAMDPKECTVDGGAGNDKLEFPSAMDSIVNGGSGNDFINFMGWCSTINGGAGNDTIQLWGWDTDLTVSGGAGKDTFRLLPNYDYEKRTVRTSTWATITDLSAEDTLHFSINPWDAISKSSPFYQKDGKISSLSAYRSDSEVILMDDSGYGVNLVLKNITDMSKLGRVKVLNGSKAKKATTLRSLISVSPLPKGITTKGSQLVIGNSFQGGFYFSNYISWAKNINASSSKKKLTIEGDAQNNIITAGSAANVLYGLGGNDKLIGGKSNDKLYGGAGKDTLNGGVGNDYLRGDAGNDTLTGGKGNDTFVYAQSTGKDVISDYNKYGKDTIHISSGSVSKVALANSNKNMVFTVGSGTVTLTGAGAKTISMKDSRGAYTLKKTALTLTNTSKGTFNASNYLTATLKTIDGRKATKAVNLYGNAMKNVIYAGKGGGTLRGYAGDDTLYGGAGKDSLYSGNGDDKLYGGAGNDYLSGDAGNDSLTGGAGVDTFAYTNGAGNDTITDYSGDLLHITSGSVSKTALSGSGVVFTVGSGSVTLTGAKGKAVSLKDSRGNYTMTNSALTLSSNFTGTLDATKYLSTVTTIDGRNATKAVNLYGNAQNNTIYGGKGGGTLDGGAGNDTLVGGAGSDVFYCGVGNDTITDYTAWQDTIELGNLTLSSVEIDGNASVLSLSNGKKVTVIGSSSKTITLKTKNETEPIGVITGTANADTLYGGYGDDWLYGGDGNDYLDGGNGNDYLYGGDGDDYLCGGGGNGWYCDTLEGGGGNDTLDGGDGYDLFRCGSVENSSCTILDSDHSDDLIEFMSDFSSAVLEDNQLKINLANGSTITLNNIYSYTSILCTQNGELKSLSCDYSQNWVLGDPYLYSSTYKYWSRQFPAGSGMAASSSGMMASSSPNVGSPAAQLASLVSTTQTGSLGDLAGSGLASPEGSGSGLIAANGTAASNPLTNKKTA